MTSLWDSALFLEMQRHHIQLNTPLPHTTPFIWNTK